MVSSEAAVLHLPLWAVAVCTPGGEKLLVTIIDRLPDLYPHQVQPVS